MEINLKIKLDKGATAPQYAIKGDVGMDLTAISSRIEETAEHAFIEYDTGVSVAIPEGYGGFVFPRSSISKYGLILSNSVGVIDQNYRGTIKARFKWIKGTRIYEPGERCCQLVILPVPNVNIEITDTLDDTERGSRGFGSTGG